MRLRSEERRVGKECARKLSITPLMESIRAILQKQFHNRRISAERTVTLLTGRVSSILLKNSIDSEIYTAEPVDKYVYHVKGGTKDRVVNHTDKTCTCRRFNLDLILYSHACATIRYVYSCLLYLCMLYHIIVIKITYSICLLVFRFAYRRNERYVSSQIGRAHV